MPRSSTAQFANSREAKEFLISKVVGEANRRGRPLSELERKMLYFTETEPSLPDILDVEQEFQEKYDDNKYEAKISELMHAAYEREKAESPIKSQQWDDALRMLRGQDHYILVMADRIRSGTRSGILDWKLWSIGIIVATATLALVFFGSWLNGLFPFPQKYLLLVYLLGAGALWVLWRIGVIDKLLDWITKHMG